MVVEFEYDMIFDYKIDIVWTKKTISDEIIFYMYFVSKSLFYIQNDLVYSWRPIGETFYIYLFIIATLGPSKVDWINLI